MSAQENKALVRRAFEEGWNAGNLDVFGEVTSPDYVLHDPTVPEDVVGVDGIKGFASAFLGAFPDLRFAIEEQVAEGDKVVTRKLLRGTHRGELMGIPPTDRPVEFAVIDIVRVADGRIVEHWNVVDQRGLLRQLGAVP